MQGLELEMEELEDLVGEDSSSNNHLSYFEECCPGRRRRVVSMSLVAALLMLLVILSGSSDSTEGRSIDTDEQGAIEKVTEPEIAVDDKQQDTVPPTKETKADTPKKSSKFAPVAPDRDQLPISDKEREELIKKWEQWHFWDGDANIRPKEDYCGKYPNRDIPGDDFPDDAWQVDAVYVNHFLNDADKLISRAMEAIFTEYGKGKPLSPDQLSKRMNMFHWEKIDMETATSPPQPFVKRGKREIGGWTTKRSQEGLVRRLLHAIMTQDTFTVVLAGHSAAAGHGNHFRQSYMMQFHRVMRPIFERLGVKLITRNISQGGLGTVQGAMGSAGIYGDEIDLMIWDSGMTENGNPDHIDLFYRQALIGGSRVPVLWGGPFKLLQMLHQEVDADVGENGLGVADMPVSENEEQVKSIPWPYQRMQCTDDRRDLCDNNRYRVSCWIDRPDGIKPEKAQLAHPKGQVKWHPGWRNHQLVGRVLAFAMLEALQQAVNSWSEGTLGGQPLDDDYWHVTDYYENIRNKVRNLDPSLGECHKINGTLPTRMCNTPMQGRTQYTPRANAEERSISALVKPAADGYVPRNEKVALYDGPDVHIPDFDVPEGEIDVLAIIENRRRRLQERVVKSHAKQTARPISNPVPESPSSQTTSRRLDGAIVPGKGWQVYDEPQGVCDGTYEAICGRSTDNECLLPGHHDARGAVIGNEFSGWLVLQLPDVKEGIIVAKLHTWHVDSQNTRTQGWTTVNNERRLRQVGQSAHGADVVEKNATADSSSSERILWPKYETPENLPDTFMFDYAIDGKITSLNKKEFMEEKKQLQRVVETITLLDDQNFSKGKAKDVEVAIRMRGCGRICVFGLSHIYWA